MKQPKKEVIEDRKALIMITTLLIIIVLLVLLIMGNVYDIVKKVDELRSIKNVSNETISRECMNLSLEKTAKCLVDIIKPIFNYTITPDNMTLTFNELKKRGGDCRDYSLAYKDLAEQINFTAYTHGIKGHRFATIQNKEGYCVLDQTSIVGCKKLGD